MKKAIVFIDANNWYHNVGNYKKPGDIDIKKIQTLWKSFEEEVKTNPSNNHYYIDEGDFNFDGYYKGKTLTRDIKDFFGKKEDGNTTTN